MGANGLVYVGSYDGAVYALGQGTGELKWTFQTGNLIASSPAIGADGTVYIGSADCRVYALEGETGVKKWEFVAGDWVRSSPALGRDGTVYVGSHDGRLYALDGGTGGLKWAFVTGAAVESSPAVGVNGLVYVGSLARTVCALDGQTGDRRWEFATGGYVQSSPAVGIDGTVYVGSWDGSLYALDGLTGSKKWSYASNGVLTAPPVVTADGTVIIGSWDGRLLAVNGTTGEPVWTLQTGGAILGAAAAAADGTVYVGAWDGVLSALNGRTGTLKWSFTSHGAIQSSPAMTDDGVVYFGSKDTRFYAVHGTAPGGLADSAWPKFRGDAHNTGRFGLPPEFSAPPESRVALEGSSFAWTPTVQGKPGPQVQWLRDGVPLAGATNATLTISSVAARDAGTYVLTATNLIGSATTAAVLGVNNVATSAFRGVTIFAPAGGALALHYADTLASATAWHWLVNLTLPTSPYVYLDLSATNTTQRFYRSTKAARLEPWTTDGVYFTAPTGSRWRVDYVDGAVGFNNWQLVTNLTLPTSPYLFRDSTAAPQLPRFYRTTPLP